MKRAPTLPLGVDVGEVRTRVALVEIDGNGAPRLVAVAARPTGGNPARAIADALAELPSRERRCVLALAPSDGVVRAAHMPAMPHRERERAARYEASRTAGIPAAAASVRVVPLADARYAIGIARSAALTARVRAARNAGLRPLAVDDAAFALCRAFADADAVVDVGENATRLVVRDDPVPTTHTFASGGRSFTAAAAAAFGIDDASAEERKRSVGLAGAGERERDALIAQIASALVDARAAGRREVRAIALAGNGSRLRGFAAALENAVALPVVGASMDADPARLPADVVAAAAPDWALAYALAVWPLAS